MMKISTALIQTRSDKPNKSRRFPSSNSFTGNIFGCPADNDVTNAVEDILAILHNKI